MVPGGKTRIVANYEGRRIANLMRQQPQSSLLKKDTVSFAVSMPQGSNMTRSTPGWAQNNPDDQNGSDKKVTAVIGSGPPEELFTAAHSRQTQCFGAWETDGSGCPEKYVSNCSYCEKLNLSGKIWRPSASGTAINQLITIQTYINKWGLYLLAYCAAEPFQERIALGRHNKNGIHLVTKMSQDCI